eukprot:7773261-Alexandrium_andersonii.AAC.1
MLLTGVATGVINHASNFALIVLIVIKFMSQRVPEHHKFEQSLQMANCSGNLSVFPVMACCKSFYERRCLYSRFLDCCNCFGAANALLRGDKCGCDC